MSAVGQAVEQVDVVDKVTGRTTYLTDERETGLLHAVVIRSAVPHGLIRDIDVARARSMPGVHDVITAADCPQGEFGPYVPDWEVLARDKVRFVGDEVAAVAAASPEAAREAAAAVTADIDPLPSVFDPHVSVTDDRPAVLWDERPDNVASRFSISRGDVDGAFGAAEHIFEGTYDTNRIYHGYLEPISVSARYERGVYILHVPSHIPYKARITYAKALGVPLERVRIVVPPIGGSFGAKYEMTVPLIAAVLAKRTGRPVRIAYDREEDAAVAHPRPPFHFTHRFALDADGRFLARETDVLGIAGGRTFWSPNVLATAVHRVDSLYRFGAMRGAGRLAYTNDNPTTCMRGFGNAESLFGIEQMIDDVAETLDIDPVELRLRNIVRKGDTTLHGWRIDSCELPACLETVARRSGFLDRRALVQGGRGTTGRRRGMGLAIGHHVSGYRGILADFDGSSAMVLLGADGSATIHVGEPDIGQGQSTILAQIAADELAIAFEAVRVGGVDSAISPAAVGTLASRATTTAGKAVQLAAAHARERLINFLADHFDVAETTLDLVDGDVTGLADPLSIGDAIRLHGRVRCGLPLIGEGVFTPPTEQPDADKYGNPSTAYPFTAHVAEVEVNCDTGQVIVVDYWAVHDSGTIINPATARGQVIGAVAQGIGWAFLEDVVLTDGIVRNPSFLDYRIPGAGDVPDVDVTFVEEPDPHGPRGAKSLAEAAINPTVAALANAVHDATGLRLTRLPMSAERIWSALQDLQSRNQSHEQTDATAGAR